MIFFFYLKTNFFTIFHTDVTLHEENFIGDIGSAGSLHRLLRGLSIQRAQKRDEFITAELTNHLFQSGCKCLKSKIFFLQFFSIQS